MIGELWLHLWLKNHCKNTRYYSIFQQSLLLLLNNYQYNCNNTISSVSAVEINQYDITMATHYDITMGNDIDRDAYCEITMGNDIDRMPIVISQWVMPLLETSIVTCYSLVQWDAKWSDSLIPEHATIHLKLFHNDKPQVPFPQICYRSVYHDKRRICIQHHVHLTILLSNKWIHVLRLVSLAKFEKLNFLCNDV